jgi:hypothetical protein
MKTQTDGRNNMARNTYLITVQSSNATALWPGSYRVVTDLMSCCCEVSRSFTKWTKTKTDSGFCRRCGTHRERRKGHVWLIRQKDKKGLIDQAALMEMYARLARLKLITRKSKCPDPVKFQTSGHSLCLTPNPYTNQIH